MYEQRNQKVDQQKIDHEVIQAIHMQKVFLGLSAMWRRKAAEMGRRADKFKRYEKSPVMFRVK